MALKKVSLDDKYDLTKDRVFVSGTQAIVRLTLMQKERDRRAKLNTAGYVTGYRGSPIGGLDQQFGRAKSVLRPNDIVFQAGLNEDLAATALWGTQQAGLTGEGKYDGVFGIWYGKGPGVDRSGDAFRHANFAGTSKNGGVIALMGDDHTCESSTTAHQSEFHFVDVMIPILNPAGTQELVDYGLYGWAMSRFTGTWTGIKCVKDTIESTAVIEGAVDRLSILAPTDFKMPLGGLNIRLLDNALSQEARLQEYKRDAILAFVRLNKLNRYITTGGRNPKIGIITTGKSYLDVRLAMDELGIDEVKANDLGIRLLKIACPWPIARAELEEFAKGLELIIVVEEKRALIEVQVREELYGTANQPVCIGKRDEKGEWLFPVKGALDSNEIAIAIGDRVLKYGDVPELRDRVNRLRQAQASLAETYDVATRMPYFCSGCPHNSSTVVPEGMRAYAGIGCHTMVIWMNRNTLGFTQMGGEGANWIGEAPFSKRNHVFQNLGDGTYNHSGILPIRASVAAGVNVTYKILFNDAVAMTGGQHHDGPLSVPMIARQMAAEGVKRVVVVTDEPWKYAKNEDWPKGLTIHHRDQLMTVQKELAEIAGVTVLIYDQTCAAEKRRRRKRHEFPDPDKRVIINELVCEGCGDCGVQSNCVSIQPLETEWGRKRQIDQSSCNKDFSCVKGFCPSFVTVHGAKLKRGAGAAATAGKLPDLPEPKLPAIDGNFRHHHHRHRRHRHRHRRRAARHGRAPRGQGLRRHRHGGPRPEGRLGFEPYAHRQPSRGHPRHPRAGQGRRPRARRRHRGGRFQEGALGHAPGGHHRRHQHPRDAARRLHAQRRLFAADRAPEEGDRHRRRPRQGPLRRCDAAGERAVRLLARPERLSPGLCLSARRPADLAGSHRDRDRAERRGGGGEQGRLRLGPPCGGRSRKRDRARHARGRRHRRAQAFHFARREDSPPRDVSHRLPERGLCRTLSHADRARARGGKGARRRATTSSPTPRPNISSSSWPTRTNTRSRACSPTARSSARSPRPSRAISASSSISRRRCSPRSIRRASGRSSAASAPG